MKVTLTSKQLNKILKLLDKMDTILKDMEKTLGE